MEGRVELTVGGSRLGSTEVGFRLKASSLSTEYMEGCRDGSLVKSPSCSGRGHVFSFQPPYSC